jgi:hypothetical protein
VISQESSSRVGGSHDSTRPQSQVLPSSPRSYQRPPALGSITMSLIGDLLMLWLLIHHRDIPAVKT